MGIPKNANVEELFGLGPKNNAAAAALFVRPVAALVFVFVR